MLVGQTINRESKRENDVSHECQAQAFPRRSASQLTTEAREARMHVRVYLKSTSLELIETRYQYQTRKQVIARMAGKAHTSSKRLLKELSNYDKEPSEALVHLAPVNDDDLMHWTAVMKGVQGTAYEGQKSHML